jgi:hypothetical protein
MLLAAASEICRRSSPTNARISRISLSSCCRSSASFRLEIGALLGQHCAQRFADDFHQEVELPGMNEKDVSVMVRNGILSLKGEKKSERDEKKDTYHLMERSYGAFERPFRLPDTIDEDQINADFDKGVLRIVAPKHPAAIKAEKENPDR